MKELQEFVNGFGFGISKEKLIEKAYRQLSADGHDCYCKTCKALKRKKWRDAKKAKESAAHD